MCSVAFLKPSPQGRSIWKRRTQGPATSWGRRTAFAGRAPGTAWLLVAGLQVLPTRGGTAPPPPTQVLARRQPCPPTTKAGEEVPGPRAPTGRGQLKLHLQHHTLAHVLEQGDDLIVAEPGQVDPVD